MSLKLWLIAFVLAGWSANASAAADLSPEDVNQAVWKEMAQTETGVSAAAVKIQVLLDRSHISPGEIDGKFGENTEKALRAFAAANGLPSSSRMTPEIWSQLQMQAGSPVIVSYTLTDDDIRGPYLKSLPEKMEDMKGIERLSYTSLAEALGERFHMSPELLRLLNHASKFAQPGETINIVDTTRSEIAGRIERVEVDKTRQTVTAIDAEGKIRAFFPASVGSEEKPTPSGKLKVVSIQSNPTYRYDPKYKFKGVSTTKPFTINGGPNNPVGSTWIGLSADSYGIHGTSEPSKVSKSESHGCVRLTNWDAQRLGKALRKGVDVVFR